MSVFRAVRFDMLYSFLSLVLQYVGESERAVRQVFQRGRNSAPCVIFFDEIDALCPRRSGHEVRRANNLRSEGHHLSEMEVNDDDENSIVDMRLMVAVCPQSGASVRVVNQLLTEMDGLETRRQVFIMAATNRPGGLLASFHSLVDIDIHQLQLKKKRMLL